MNNYQQNFVAILTRGSKQMFEIIFDQSHEI